MRVNAFLFFLMFAARAFALYNGNPFVPAMPESGVWIPKDFILGVKGGYLGDFVYDRELKLAGKRLLHSQKQAFLSRAIYQCGTVTLNIADRVEVFTTLGAFSCHLHSSHIQGVKTSCSSSGHFSWGLGGRVLLAYWGDLELGFSASYLSCDSPSSVTMYGHSHQKSDASMDCRQWQVGGAIAYKVRWFIPYLGIDYSDFRAKFHQLRDFTPYHHLTFKEKYPLGMYLGAGLFLERGFNVNLEARCINESALSLSADFKF